MLETMVASAIATALASKSWEVIAQKLNSRRTRRYDLVATSPKGEKFVIEVKTGEGRAHFGQVAQVEALASDLKEEDPSHTAPTPILVTTMEVPRSIQGAAETVGVEIVKATGSETEIAKTLVDYLDHRERGASQEGKKPI